MKKTLVICLCGASGAIYGIQLLKALSRQSVNIHFILSNAGRMVLEHEMGYQGEPFEAYLSKQGITFRENASIFIHEPDNLFAPPASGSFRHSGMVIAPCSMKTLAAIASGIAGNLIHRAADVCLKEKRPLILVVRETPLNVIHLDNMHRAALAGATIMPACPGFYHHPKNIPELADTVVARVLDHLNIEHCLMKPWGEQDD